MKSFGNNWVASALLFCLLGVGSIFAAQTAHHEHQPPNVFLITIDTLRPDHVHCYGYNNIETPALDSLAKNGIRFTNAFTPAPITNVSHASILTGLQPSSHGVTDFGIPLAAAHPTWAQLLKVKSYQTAAFIGAIVLDSKTLAPGFDRGFDFYDNFPVPLQTKDSHNTPRWGRVERRGLEVISHAETWVNLHPTGPEFVWIHLYDPHDPYEPPPPFSLKYKEHLYDGEIAYADSALNGFLKFLKQKGQYENSLIIVVGDHGEGLGEHNEQTHGIFLYDSTTHVPLIIKLPFGLQASEVIGAQVRTTDILPTVLDILNVPAPASLDGVSLKFLFDGTEREERILVGETDYPLAFGWAPLRSSRAYGIKYIEAPRPELYDLRIDPGELNNLYRPWDERVKKSREILARAKPAAVPAASLAPVGSNTLDELKALGYLGKADVGSSTTAPEPSLLPDPKDKIEEQNLLHVAMIARDDNRLEIARSALEKTLELDPDSIAALQQLGELELETGNYSKATGNLRRVHELRPQDASLEFKLALALQKQEDFTAARDALADSLRLAPDQFAARVSLGQVYLALANGPEASDQFQAALLLKPDSLEAALDLARAEIAMNSFEAAVQELAPFGRAHPRSPEVFDLLAEVYTKTGKTEEAKRAQKTAQLLRHANPK
jgi:choline-sulfatase